MSELDWLLVCLLLYLVGIISGWTMCRYRDNYMWRNISPWMLEQVAMHRRAKWEQEKREEHEPNCGL